MLGQGGIGPGVASSEFHGTHHSFLKISMAYSDHKCFTLGGRGQPLPGVIRGYPLISPKSGM